MTGKGTGTGQRTAFDEMAQALLTEEMKAHPVLASSVGLVEHDAALPDLSADAQLGQDRAEDDWLLRFRELSDHDLTLAERIDRSLVVMAFQGRQVMRDWHKLRRMPDSYTGTALGGVHRLVLNRLRPAAELADAVVARLEGTPALLAVGKANLDPALANADLVRRAIGQARSGAAYVHRVANEFPEDLRARVQRAGDVAALAYDDFAAHLEELAQSAEGGWAIGEERYDGLLRHAEGLTYGAREMREQARETLAELQARIRKELTAAGRYDGDDWQQALASLGNDAPDDEAAMLRGYQQQTVAAREFCREHGLVTLLDGEECVVQPAPLFVRPMVAVASYIFPPPFTRTTKGYFSVPYAPDGAGPELVAERLHANDYGLMPAITAHEAYPGHHWHLSRFAAVNGRPLRNVLASTYFTEGWGLYSEQLMAEHGFYSEPAHLIRQLQSRAFRAARVVVDTSLHLGEMTVEEAVAYLVANTLLTDRTARAEVLRYCAWPTQAASYLTGALEIERLRAQWLAGRHGTLREFHDRLGESGRLPLVLTRRHLGLDGSRNDSDE